MAEIEEFYSYVEMPQAVENLKAWEDSYMPGTAAWPKITTGANWWLEWMKAGPLERKTHVQLLLESLEHKDTEIRFTNARRLFYVLQGGAKRRFSNMQSLSAPLQALSPRQVRQRTNCTGYLRMPKLSGMQMVLIASWRPSRLQPRSTIFSGNLLRVHRVTIN